MVVWNEDIGLEYEGSVVGSEKSCLRRVLCITRAEVCFIQESKLELVSKEIIRKFWGDANFGFKFFAAVGNSRGIITIWDKSRFAIGSYCCFRHFVAVEGSWVIEGAVVTLINVYAPSDVFEQKQAWEEIGELKVLFLSPRILEGDFNAVRNRSERSNCVGLLMGSKEFNRFIKILRWKIYHF